VEKAPTKKDDLAKLCIVYTDIEHYNREAEKLSKQKAAALKLTTNTLCNWLLRQQFDTAHQITDEVN
jgi:hypothetical protein